jgi:hypothetical protein
VPGIDLKCVKRRKERSELGASADLGVEHTVPVESRHPALELVN